MSEEPDIGSAIRRIRKERSLTIDDMTASTGLSRAYISQIETNKASPSLPTIRKICNGLGISPAVLFEDHHELDAVIRANRRAVLRYDIERDGAVYTKLVRFLSHPGRNLEVALLDLSPKHMAGDHTHAGEEVFYLLEGEITVTYGNHDYVLRSGDSIHIDARKPHKIYNHCASAARILSARTPPGLIELGQDEVVTRVDLKETET